MSRALPKPGDVVETWWPDTHAWGKPDSPVTQRTVVAVVKSRDCASGYRVALAEAPRCKHCGSLPDGGAAECIDSGWVKRVVKRAPRKRGKVAQ